MHDGDTSIVDISCKGILTSTRKKRNSRYIKKLRHHGSSLRNYESLLLMWMSTSPGGILIPLFPTLSSVILSFPLAFGRILPIPIFAVVGMLLADVILERSCSGPSYWRHATPIVAQLAPGVFVVAFRTPWTIKSVGGLLSPVGLVNFFCDST